MEKKNNRNNIIDVLKGIAVISVLLGHAIQRGLCMNGYNPLNNWIFKIIYTYHMPLFVVLSGFVLAQYTKKYDCKFLLKKVMRLLYPTILWSYLIWLMRNYNFVGIKEFIPFPNSFIGYTKNLFFHPDFVIWFLFIIFVYDVWFFLLKKINNKNDMYLNIILSILFYLILCIIPVSNFGVYNIHKYFPLFAFGYFLDTKCLKKISLKYSAILLIMYLILLFNFPDTYLFNYPVFYLMSLLAIFIIYQIVIRIRKFRIINVLSFLGKYSLEIYLCQCLCLNIGIGSGYLRVATIFISATTISLLLSIFTNKITILRKILYGKF